MKASRSVVRSVSLSPNFPASSWARPAGAPASSLAIGREVFLFGQPRPVARLEAGAPSALAQDLGAKLSDKCTDLTTDLEAFNTEPLV